MAIVDKFGIGLIRTFQTMTLRAHRGSDRIGTVYSRTPKQAKGFCEG